MAAEPSPTPGFDRLAVTLGALAIGVVAALSLTDSDGGGATPEPTQIASDTAADPDPLPFWGRIDCADPSRHRRYAEGGDPSLTATGTPQPDQAFRRLRVLDGDDFFGERCELGANNISGPVAFYREGQRLLTFASFRLPPDFPLGAKNFQGVLQMKQAQPANNGGGTPVISLSAYRGAWQLFHSGPGITEVDQELWRTPAVKGVWTRVAIEALYSQDPAKGWIELRIDGNGDGDFGDEGEVSPRFVTNTLKRESAGGIDDGLAEGDSIPSHLRIGLYHDARIPCPPPAGCSVDADNVQVLIP